MPDWAKDLFTAFVVVWFMFLITVPWVEGLVDRIGRLR